MASAALGEEPTPLNADSAAQDDLILLPITGWTGCTLQLFSNRPNPAGQHSHRALPCDGGRNLERRAGSKDNELWALSHRVTLSQVIFLQVSWRMASAALGEEPTPLNADSAAQDDDLGQGFCPCDGLANRCLRPLGHLSATGFHGG